MEAILATKTTKGEFLLSKYAAYFMLSMASVIFCLFLIIFVFRVPFYGSFLALMLVSSFFMLGSARFWFFCVHTCKGAVCCKPDCRRGGFYACDDVVGVNI